MFIDSHCHLDFPCFSENLLELLSQLAEKKITHLIIPATQKSCWKRLQTLCAEHTQLYYTFGIHPHFLNDFQNSDLLLLAQLLEKGDKQCVAIGEIGLDKFSDTDLSLQEAIFIQQLQLAEQFNLPIVLHVVKLQSRVLQILKSQQFSQGGVYHGFSGSYEIAMEFIKLGFKLGIGGVITYPNAVKIKQTVSRLPIESILLETDAPDMPIYQQQEKYNSPLNILITFECLAQLRDEPKNCLAAQIIKNTEDLFSLNNDEQTK